jgi:ATP phosphoribosyltransferase regulatory subunit
MTNRIRASLVGSLVVRRNHDLEGIMTKNTTYQPPTGARDLLPIDVLQKNWIEDRLQQVFARWGYSPIVTSTLERLDTLMAGGAIDRSTVVQVRSDDSELGLRPELTASIARAAGTRLANAPTPLRLSYATNVFRKQVHNGRIQQQELYQAGVELLGSATVLADSEILLLLGHCLSSLGLEPAADRHAQWGWSLVLGEATLTKSLIAPFPPAVQAALRQALVRLDRLAIEALDLSDDLRQQALTLLDLRGDPTVVLDRLRRLPLSPDQLDSVDRLERLLSLAQAMVPGGPPPIVLDLSLIQSFDYYTGLTFDLVYWTPTDQWVLGQGGRYDQLLALYHPQGEPSAGIGFSLDIEHLQQVLLSADRLPLGQPYSDWLVVPTTPDAHRQAIDYAQTLKDQPELLRVELYLADRPGDLAPDRVRDYAKTRRIRQLVWVGSGEPTIESFD